MTSNTVDVRHTSGDATRYQGDAYTIITDGEVSVILAASHTTVGEYGVATLLAPVPGDELPSSVERVHGLSYHDAPPGVTIRVWLDEYAREHTDLLEDAHHAFDIPTPEVTR